MLCEASVICRKSDSRFIFGLGRDGKRGSHGPPVRVKVHGNCGVYQKRIVPGRASTCQRQGDQARPYNHIQRQKEIVLERDSGIVPLTQEMHTDQDGKRLSDYYQASQQSGYPERQIVHLGSFDSARSPNSGQEPIGNTVGIFLVAPEILPERPILQTGAYHKAGSANTRRDQRP